jgi:hypothetical protein
MDAAAGLVLDPGGHHRAIRGEGIRVATTAP